MRSELPRDEVDEEDAAETSEDTEDAEDVDCRIASESFDDPACEVLQ